MNSKYNLSKLFKTSWEIAHNDALLNGGDAAEYFPQRLTEQWVLVKRNVNQVTPEPVIQEPVIQEPVIQEPTISESIFPELVFPESDEPKIVKVYKKFRPYNACRYGTPWIAQISDGKFEFITNAFKITYRSDDGREVGGELSADFKVGQEVVLGQTDNRKPGKRGNYYKRLIIKDEDIITIRDSFDHVLSHTLFVYD